MNTEKSLTSTQPIEATEQEPTSNLQACNQPTLAQTNDELLTELASLPALEYEQRRTAAVQTLGITGARLDKLIKSHRAEKAEPPTAEQLIFDEVEPWPEPVRGDAVLTEVYQLLQKYIIADEQTLRAATLWCALTWLIDHTSVMPLALITAPTRNCGKTVLLTAMSYLCHKSINVSSISSAAMYRAIEKWHPSLSLDEADTFLKQNPELVGIINSGHTRDSAHVIRSVGDNHEPAVFSTWCPKALAGINIKNTLPDTLVSRSIILELRRKLSNEKVTSLRIRAKRDFKAPKRKLMRFTQDIAMQFTKTVPPPFGLDNRAADNWECLIAIADIAGGEWQQAARRTALHIEKNAEDTLNISQELLVDIRTAFKTTKASVLPTATLLSMLCNNPDLRWAKYKEESALSSNQLAALLKEYGITPKQLGLPAPIGNLKGYKLAQFSDAFDRYLPPETTTAPSNTQVTTDFAARALEPNKTKDSKPIPSARTSHSLAPEKSLQTNQNNGSSALAPKNDNIPDCSEVAHLEPLATRQQPHADCLAELDAAEEF